MVLTLFARGQQISKTNITIQKAAPILYLNGTSAAINFYNSDLVLQQSSNLLTLSGGDFSLGSNNLLGTGSIGATGSRLLKGWFTNLEITNLPTINGGTLASALSLSTYLLKSDTASMLSNYALTSEISASSMDYPSGSGIPVVVNGTSWGTTIATEAYSTENYGATGTGDIVLSTGPTLTTVNITDVIKLTPTASPPSGATEGMIYADTDHHIYYFDGTSWKQLDN